VNNKVQDPGRREKGPEVGDFNGIASIRRASDEFLAGAIAYSNFCQCQNLRICPTLVMETGAHLVRFLFFYRFFAVLAKLHGEPTT
jgi:hypothetical protein